MSDRLVKRTNTVAATTHATPIATRSHPCPQQTGAVSRNAGLGAPLPSLASNPLSTNDTTQRGPPAFGLPNAPAKRGRPPNTLTASAATNTTSVNPLLAGSRAAMSIYDRMLSTIRPSTNVAPATANQKPSTSQTPNLLEGTPQQPHTCTLVVPKIRHRYLSPSSSRNSISDDACIRTDARTRTTGRRSPLVLLARLFDEPSAQPPRPPSVVVETTGTSTTPPPERNTDQTPRHQIPTPTPDNGADHTESDLSLHR